MLMQKLCMVETDEPYMGMILTEPTMNPNGYFCFIVANVKTGKLKTVKCDMTTLVPDTNTLENS